MQVKPDDTTLVIEEVTDPGELAAARVRRARFDTNSAWFQARAKELYPQYRGKCIVIADEQIFAGDTPEEAWAQVEAAQINDDGSFSLYIPKDVVSRIYAH
jgi:hypothetical protein